MPTCPEGHQSTEADFCDVCGMRIDPGPAGSSAAPAPVPAPASQEQASGIAPAAGPRETCPNCGAERSGLFCEVCGLNFGAAAVLAGAPTPAPPRLPEPVSSPGPASPPGPVSPPDPAVGSWVAVVTADRAYYDSVMASAGPDADPIEFPAYCPERQFRLTGAEMRIGRRSASRGLEPEIDLTGPPADTAVSHLHAVLLARADGSWAVLDPGSANGTEVNGIEIAPNERVTLHDGDRIGVGGWTILTIRSG
jgi:hypothetical protein